MDFEYAEGWRPKDGDTLIGRVTDLSMGNSEYGSYPIVTVQPEDGDAVAVHCFHTSLNNQMQQIRPRVGETVGIKFKGKTKTKDGKREVAVYVVKVKGRTVDVWGQAAPLTPPPPDIPATVEDFAPSPGNAATDDDIPF